MRRLAGALTALALVGSTACGSAGPVPADPFEAQTRALRDGDYRAACEQFSGPALTELPGLAKTPRADVLSACAQQLQDLVTGLEAAPRKALLGQEAVSTRRTGQRANVTVEQSLYGATVRATGTAVLEDGDWKVTRPPSGEHVGSERVLLNSTESMTPGFRIGDYLLYEPNAYRLKAPERGSVVVLNPPEDQETCGTRRGTRQACPRAAPERSNELFLKRVVAGPGDRIAIRGGLVVLNGKPQPEPYATPCRGDLNRCELPDAITVPEHHYFVTGDRRGASQDSRFFGPVPLRNILGPARLLGPPR